MSVTQNCDKCKKSAPSSAGGGPTQADVPYDWVLLTPGYVGTLLLCRPCYEAWITQVRNYFS